MMKGFTLVELLVTMAVTAISLTMISGTIYLTVKISNDVIYNSSQSYKIMKLKDYIIDNKITTNTDFVIDSTNDDLIYRGNTLFNDINVKEISFYLKDDFTYSFIEYENSNGKIKNLSFVVV